MPNLLFADQCEDNGLSENLNDSIVKVALDGSENEKDDEMKKDSTTRTTTGKMELPRS